MAEQGRRWRAWRQPGAWSLTGLPRSSPGRSRHHGLGAGRDRRRLGRGAHPGADQAPAVRRRGRGGRGRRRCRRRRPGPSAPARRHAAGRLDARDGRPGGPAPGAGGLAGHPRRHVQRVRRGAARAAGPRARRHVVPHQDLVARGRRQRAGGRRRGATKRPSADRPSRVERGSRAGRVRRGRCRTRCGVARGPGRAVPERVRRRRDRHGHDDPAGPDRAGQRRPVPHPRPAERGAPRAAPTARRSSDEAGAGGRDDGHRRQGRRRGDPRAPAGGRRLPAHHADRGARPRRPAAVPLRAVPGRDPAADRRAGAEAQRAAVPPHGRRRPRVRHLHAGHRGARHQLERRRGARQGLDRRRGDRPALPHLLSARAAGGPAPGARARRRGAGRGLPGGGVAGPQGRQPVLGLRHHHQDHRRGRPAHRLRQGDP